MRKFKAFILILPLSLLFTQCAKKSSNTAPPACYTNKTGLLVFTNPSPLSDSFTILISADSTPNFSTPYLTITLASQQTASVTLPIGTRYWEAFYHDQQGTGPDTIKQFTVVACDTDSVTFTHFATMASDRRLKKDIVPLEDPLEKLLQLPVYSFIYNRTDFPQMSLPDGRFNGFMAQDMDCLFPELVQTGHNGYYSINYTGMIPILTKALQQQQQQIQALQKEVKALKARERDWGI